jgi:hypothetical protein
MVSPHLDPADAEAWGISEAAEHDGADTTPNSRRDGPHHIHDGPTTNPGPQFRRRPKRHDLATAQGVLDRRLYAATTDDADERRVCQVDPPVLA